MCTKNTLCWTAAVTLLAAGATAFVLVNSHTPTTAAAATLVSSAAVESSALTGNRLAQDLLEAGLSPKHMCASGATVAQASAAWTAAAAEASAVSASMDTARSSIETATKGIQRLERLVRSGQAEAADVTELATLRTQLATQTALRDGLIADIRAEALARLDAGCSAKLDELHEPDLGLDAIYRVVSRSQADAVALREAIADAYVSTKRGREPADASTRLIGDAETDPAVAAAKTYMASRMAPIQAEWDVLLAGG